MSQNKRSSFEKLIEKYYEGLSTMDEWEGVNSDEYAKAEKRALKHLKQMHWYYPNDTKLFEEAFQGF